MGVLCKFTDLPTYGLTHNAMTKWLHSLKGDSSHKNEVCEASRRQLKANFSCPQLSSFGPFRKLRKLLSCRQQIFVKNYVFDRFLCVETDNLLDNYRI